jgi:hypothetical protein
MPRDETPPHDPQELEAARRAVDRQAAPFSRGTRVTHPRRPGRKSGALYGPRAHRQRPAVIEESHDAPLPPHCPRCHGRVREVRVATQYQEELPVQPPIVRAFRVHIGECVDCGRRLQVAIRCKPRMPSAPPRSNWGRRRPPWPCC